MSRIALTLSQGERDPFNTVPVRIEKEAPW
jgi:hypothetical protein